MNSKEKKEVISLYNKRLNEFGEESPKSLGWTKGNQDLRFKVFDSYWQLTDKDSILDFGCGFGDFASFLRDQKHDCHYTGVDINKRLLEVARKKNIPNSQFIDIDFLQDSLDQQFDYIFSSGVHNIKVENNEAFIEKTFERFYNNCNKGFAINFMSSKADIQYDNNHYSNPEKILSLAYKYSKRVSLINNYMPFEFTIFIDKRELFNEKTTFY